MKFGYFTLTDTSPSYGASRRDPDRFLREVAEESIEAEATERFARDVMPHFADAAPAAT